MRPPLSLLRGLGILVLGFVTVFAINLPHDGLLNAVAAGSAVNHVPVGPRAELLSLGVVLLAGVAASSLVGLLAGTQRRGLLLLLTGLFLLVDVAGVLGPFVRTSIGYRVAVVALVPLEVWVGYRLARTLKPEPVRLGGEQA